MKHELTLRFDESTEKFEAIRIGDMAKLASCLKDMKRDNEPGAIAFVAIMKAITKTAIPDKHRMRKAKKAMGLGRVKKKK